jgi:hypothetical protein
MSQRAKPVVESVEFEWQSAIGGYRWVSAIMQRDGTLLGVGDDDRRLNQSGWVRVLVPARIFETRKLQPLELEPGLHRLLAAVDKTEAAISHFASLYGPLAKRADPHDARGAYVNLANFENYGDPLVPCDRFRYWTDEIDALARAIDLWDRCRRNPDAEALNSISALISDRLKDFHFVARPNANGIELRLRPNNLQAAAWLQFARETQGLFELQTCRECHRWFKYYPDQIKTERIYCSAACRAKVHRRKQLQVASLHRGGIPSTTIAERVRSDVKTVEKWIAALAQRNAPPPRDK